MLYFLGWFCMLLLAPFVVYGVALLVGYVFSCNKKHQYTKKGILVGIGSNGFHTEFVFPLQEDRYNWQQKFPTLRNSSSASPYQYLSFGWGDRAIYLDLPAWSELSWSLGFKTLFLPTPSLMRVVGFRTWSEKDYQSLFFIKLSLEEFNQLCGLVLQSFSLGSNKAAISVTAPNFDRNNYFFEAKAPYHAFNTCNIWVNRILKKSGIRTALWSPLDKAILFHLKQSKAEVVPLETTTHATKSK